MPVRLALPRSISTEEIGYPPHMGVLANEALGTRVTLGRRALVGRSEACSIRLTAGEVSAEHASCFWRAGAWWVRDLGSTNGTFVGAKRLQPGERVRLEVGAVLGFGGEENGHRWRLVEEGPPIVRARRLADGAIVEGTPELLCLPDDEDPELTIYVSALQRWEGDFGAATREVADQSVVQLGADAWLLELPPPGAGDVADTAQAGGLGRTLEACALRFRVSRDEEHVEVELECGGERSTLPPRTFHYTLLTLARQRLADGSQPELPESEHGWVYVDELVAQLGSTRARLNLEAHRARQLFDTLGIEGAGRIIDRRTGTRQLRIGVPRLQVERLE